MNQLSTKQLAVHEEIFTSGSTFVSTLQGVIHSHDPKPLQIFRFSCPAMEIVESVAKSDLQIIGRSSGRYTVVKESEHTGRELDYSSQSSFLDLHQDGIELTDVPEYGLLICCDPGSTEAPTIFSDSFAIVDEMTKCPRHSAVMESLDRVFVDKNGREALRPLVERYRDTNRYILNFGSRIYLRPKNVASAPAIRDVSAMLTKLLEAADTSVFHRHLWKTGDVVLFDNRRTLHGRASATRDEKRCLVRFLLSRDRECMSRDNNFDSVANF